MDIQATSASLVRHFRKIHEGPMRGLPILNTRLEVCAVGFREFDGHAVGVIITPWFMNLMLLPGTAQWSDAPQGSVANVEFPGSKIEFNVSHDEETGTLLSAALFSSVADFPDQDTAVHVATEVLDRLFAPSVESRVTETPSISRRELFTNLGAD
jgi:[NiFe] hydrogenase assembly HybE family chaperone